MKKKHKDFMIRFHKPTSRHLYTLRNGGISERSDFALRNKDTYLTFILNCRSDYLVAYPKKEQKTYRTKLTRMKFTFKCARIRHEYK